MGRDRVLITGSSKGLGRELALKFSKEGYDVVLHGRNSKDLENVKEEVLSHDVECDYVVGDLKEDTCLEELGRIAREKEITILINNAGIMSKGLPLEVKDSEIDEVLSVNLLSVMKLTNKVYKYFFEKKSGMIIMINSTGGISADVDQATYNASKHGLKGYTDCLRMDAKKNNVRVLGIYPGGIKTTFFERIGGRKPEKLAMCMEPSEISKIAYDLTGYDSVHVDEIVLNRMRK